jgi:hypothetical protein
VKKAAFKILIEYMKGLKGSGADSTRSLAEAIVKDYDEKQVKYNTCVFLGRFYVVNMCMLTVVFMWNVGRIQKS